MGLRQGAPMVGRERILSLLDRWKSWSATPAKMRSLLVEASWELLRARLLVAFSLRKTLPRVLKPGSTEATNPPEQLCRDVRYIIWLAARNVPWRSLCLPNAIAAQRMLSRRGYASTLHLGVGHHADGAPHAHAWLEAAGYIVTGQDGMQAVTPLPYSAATGQLDKA